MEDILASIKKQKRLQKFGLALISLTMSALIYNIFLLPLNIVSGGVSGVATITNHLYDIDPSLMIFILSAACSIISLMYLGFEQTAGTIVASIIYPLLVKITAPIATLIPIETNDIFIIVIFAGVLSGIASGLFYRSGYVNCGFPVICKVLYQNFKIAISKSTLVINVIVVFFGGIFFGSLNAMYAIILLYISSLVMDKVILGISNNKAFYIITSEEDEVKEYIIDKLHHNVTTFDVKGGFLEKKRKVLLSVIPSREYYKVTEGIKNIDKEAFFVVTDSYEVIGGK
ncbi:MAG: YitT family protein [Bacilli bacterium]|nr:YitT family protein [Bacilli bacterium]